MPDLSTLELSIGSITGIITLGAVVLMVTLWLWQQHRRDASIVDAGWAFGIGAGAVIAAVFGTGDIWSRIVIGMMGALWGWRLAWHLLRDRVIGRHEDGRYAHMRQALGRHASLVFFAFFIAQAGLVVLFALPFVLLSVDSRSPGWHTFIAAVIWLTAVIGESIADRQLARWRSDPANRGRTCRHGLWAWSRHPNYACEWLHWWAYVVLGIGTTHGIWLWLWPGLMFAFLWWVTGIPHVERRCLETRGDDYRDYQRRVPVLFPWFPRSES